MDEDKRRVQDIRINKNETYDCAFLEPLAFPPDFPPVILKDLVVWVGKDEFELSGRT